MGLDLSEARASLLSGDVVELTNATSTDSTSMKLVWEVSKAHILSTDPSAKLLDAQTHTHIFCSSSVCRLETEKKPATKITYGEIVYY